jgi:hypothetical protein
MDCCSHGPHTHASTLDVERRAYSIGAMLSGGVAPRGSTAAAQTVESASAALDVLRKSICIDVHTHGGTTGITSQAPPSADLATGMRAGSLAVACLADVPDAPSRCARRTEYTGTGLALQISSRSAGMGRRDGRQSWPAACAFRG